MGCRLESTPVQMLDGAYYERLIEQQLSPQHASRKSVEITPIHLTTTRAETIATWKKDWRRLERGPRCAARPRSTQAPTK
ncbi:hypothetical protein EI94DRAFT_1890789 [Lactarius quietus]|nr:hypothetical protein EI94DRAFT_1890789 [Lactarius quietus]